MPVRAVDAIAHLDHRSSTGGEDDTTSGEGYRSVVTGREKVPATVVNGWSRIVSTVRLSLDRTISRVGTRVPWGRQHRGRFAKASIPEFVMICS